MPYRPGWSRIWYTHLAWDSSFLFYLNKNLYIYYIYTYIHSYICIYIGYVLRISSHERSCCDKMTDWEVEALNEGEAFFQLIHFPFLKKYSYICFFWPFLKNKNPVIFTLKYLLFIGRRKETFVMSDRVSRVFISLYKRQHYWPPTFCRQIWTSYFSFGHVR